MTFDFSPVDGLYRFVHPRNANSDGSLNSSLFNLRGDKELSLGIERLIPLARFDDFCKLKPHHGVARVSVRDAISENLTVTQSAEPEWGEFAQAHAIFGGYDGWTSSKKNEVARKLRDIANDNILRRPY